MTFEGKNELIPHMIEGDVVNQRSIDGYINATAMCKAAGKQLKHYNSLKSTDEYLIELSRSVGIPTDLLFQPIMTGPNDLRGTWVHPRVAIHLAQWLSPRFAVLVSQWVYDWMTKGKPSGPAELPYHLRRYVKNYSNVPQGHFSVLTEMTLMLIAPMEMMGYTLPESMWPDISEGRMFADWLRKEHEIEPNSMPTYMHDFEDGRKAVRARAYPDYLLADFRKHFREEWLPKRSRDYFQRRDKPALDYLPRILPPPETKAG